MGWTFGRILGTTWKINGWNLQITHFFQRNMIFPTSIIMFHVHLEACKELKGWFPESDKLNQILLKTKHWGWVSQTEFCWILTLRSCRCIFSACENLGAALLTMAAALTGAGVCFPVGHRVGMGQIWIKRDFPLPEEPGPSYSRGEIRFKQVHHKLYGIVSRGPESRFACVFFPLLVCQDCLIL